MLFLLVAFIVSLAACGSASEPTSPTLSHGATTALEISHLATSEQTPPSAFMGEATTIAMGNHRAVRVMPDGRVATVGSNSGGRLSTVNGWDNIVAVAMGNSNIIGLRSDGTVVEEGLHNHRGRPRAHQGSVDSWRDVVAVATSGWHHIVAVATGRSYTIGLRSDGTIVSTGRNATQDLPEDVAGWHDIVAISGGQNHAIGLRPDGTVVATRGGFTAVYKTTVDWRDIRMPTDIPASSEEPSVISLPTIESTAADLFTRINELRTEASQLPLVRDEGLDRIAIAYATQIFFDVEARSGYFQTLPNGERVISLAHLLDVEVTGFDYSVFLGLA